MCYSLTSYKIFLKSIKNVNYVNKKNYKTAYKKDSDKTENDINWTYDAGDKIQKNSDVILFDDRTILAEGDYCYNANKGVEGICTLANNCPDVLSDFRNKGIKPIICSYLANDIVVCCPQSQDSIDINIFDQSSTVRRSEQSKFYI